VRTARWPSATPETARTGQPHSRQAGHDTRATLAYIRANGDSDTATPPPFALRGPQIGTADLPEALEGLATIVTLR
jgi:hypothetical protein